MEITGTFDIQMKPLQAHTSGADGVQLSVLSITKQYQGPLTGTSLGHFLGAVTAVEGSAGYVAQEQIRGMLEGRQGSFVVQHFAISGGDAPQFKLTIIPDSGTGALHGISGTMSIDMVGDQHTYTLDYELPSGE